MKVNKNKAVFLDRDGVINKKALKHDYVKKWKEFRFLPHVAEAIRILNKKFLVIIVSNQRGIARGMMSKEDVELINEKMSRELEKKNARIDGIYFCPHDVKDNCNCRKPKPGMLLRAANDFKINLTESYMIGDDLIDIEAGKRAGCETILVSNSKNTFSQKIKAKKSRPDYIVSNLLEATKIIKIS
jgi:histidinol-phosphate phosphatase family protein